MTTGIYDVPIAAIKLDWEVYPRMGLDENRILEFRDLIADPEVPSPLPPIELVPHVTEPNRFWVADGAHRLGAYQDEGRTNIPAVILPRDTDVYLHAVKRAAISPKPLTRAEKRTAVLRNLSEHPDWSNHRIADELGVSRPFVAQLRSGGNVPMAPAEAEGNVAPKDGKAADDDVELAPPKFGPDLAQLALRQLVRAYREGYGRAKFGFGNQISPKTISRFVARLHDEEREAGIQALRAWGEALADHQRWLPGSRSE